MGWSEARRISGTNWLPDAMLPLLNDPYEAVRLIAWRSLRKDARFSHVNYDPLASEEERLAAISELRNRAHGQGDPELGPIDPMALINDRDGELGEEILTWLLEKRDDRPVFLVE